jgi:AraC-like DNA-binding protein
MIALDRIPSAPLDLFVDRIWYHKAPVRSVARVTAMPSGDMGIIVPLADNEMSWWNGPGDSVHHRHRGLALIGAKDSRIALDSSQLGEVIGVQFKPGGAYPFFGPSAREFLNTHAGLEDLWGPSARALHDRLRETRSVPAKFDILERELLDRAERALSPDRAIAHALARFRASPHDSVVRAVAEVTGMTTKAFIARFSDQVGVTPKLYRRIERFRRVLTRVHGQHAIRWTRVAADCGYYDQSHFVRDFREFSGFTPTDFARLRTDDIEHVALPDPEFRTSRVG